MTSTNRILSLGSSLLLLLASIAAAETIRFDPPGATAHHSVDAILAGSWPNSCLPTVKSVAVDGSTITLHLNAALSPDAACFQAVTHYTLTFHLDVLPAGSYTIVAVADANAVSSELARKPLIVRDSETLFIGPYAVPTTGGHVAILSSNIVAGATLTIGGITVPANLGDGDLFAEVPPHAAGAVDVVINSTAGSVTAKAALIYYDPGTIDTAVFEPILFPMSFQGAGSFGSQWTTESFLSGSGFFRDPPPCPICLTTFIAGTSQLTNDANPWGHVLYAMRGTFADLDFASRIRDTSRQTKTAGTEVPVVRERDFRGQIRLLNIPVDAHDRFMLRLWSLGDYPQFIALVDSLPPQPISLSVTKVPGTEMWFGSIDVTPLVTNANVSPTSVTVYPSGYGSSSSPLPFPPIWGMLSITNNDTQQVTIISPK